MAPEVFEERNIAKRGALFEKVDNWQTRLHKCEQETNTIGNEMAQLRTRLESLLTQIATTRVELDSNIRPHQCKGTDSTLATKPFPDLMGCCSSNGKDQLSEYVTAMGSSPLRCESRGSLTCEADEDTAEACCRIEEECLLEMAFCSSVDNVPPAGHPVDKTCSRSSDLFEADINLILDSLLTCSDREEAQSFDEEMEDASSSDDLSCVDADGDDDKSVSSLEMTAEISDVWRDPTSTATQSTHDICVTRVGDEEEDKDQCSPAVSTMSEIQKRDTSEDAHILCEKEEKDGFVFEEDLLSIISEVNSCISGEVQAMEKDVCPISESVKSVVVCEVWGDSESEGVFDADMASVKDDVERLETRKEEYIAMEDSDTDGDETETKRKGESDEMTAEMRGQDKDENGVIPSIASKTTDREHGSAERESDDDREASERVVAVDDRLDTVMSVDGDSSASTHPMYRDEGNHLNDIFGPVTVCRADMSSSDEAESDSESDGQATELRSISIGGIKAASFLFEEDHHCHYKSVAATTEEIASEIVAQEICPTESQFRGLRALSLDTVPYDALDREELDKTLSGDAGGSDTEIDRRALSIGLGNREDPERAIQLLNEVYGEMDESPVDTAEQADQGRSNKRRWLRLGRFWSLRRAKRVFSLRRSQSEDQSRVRDSDVIQFHSCVL